MFRWNSGDPHQCSEVKREYSSTENGLYSAFTKQNTTLRQCQQNNKKQSHNTYFMQSHGNHFMHQLCPKSVQASLASFHRPSNLLPLLHGPLDSGLIWKIVFFSIRWSALLANTHSSFESLNVSRQCTDISPLRQALQIVCSSLIKGTDHLMQIRVYILRLRHSLLSVRGRSGCSFMGTIM